MSKAFAHHYPPYDVHAVRKDFPILSRTVHNKPGKQGKPLIYFDNAASAQKPKSVVDTITHCYEYQYANIHRGIHYLSQKTTQAYEQARTTVARFLGAPKDESIIFTRNATEAFNLLAHSFGAWNFKSGDNVILSIMEHHSNIVPWQLLQQQYNLTLKVVPIDREGCLDLNFLSDAIDEKTKLISITHCSNVLGSITPAQDITRLAHEKGVAVAFDGSQAVVHQPVDVRAIDADFYIFTGHKLYGPNAIGVLYGKSEYLKRMPPYQGGGEMISQVSFRGTTFKDPPARFEAGTPPIVEALGLATAMDYLHNLGWQAITTQEQSLLTYVTQKLSAIDQVHLFGTTPNKAAIVSFLVEGIHPHDIGMLLDQEGIAVRVGHHCAEPLMDALGISATTRASFAFYNTHQEIDIFCQTLSEAIGFFANV